MARTEKGKPYLLNDIPSDLANFNFNVSHQGDYAVLASESIHQVGIDVMKVEVPSKSFQVYRPYTERTLCKQVQYNVYLMLYCK